MTNDLRPAEPVGSATVTRSEERLDVRTEAVPVERVRLEKYIVSEERTMTVTVRREEVRLVREPVSGAPSLSEVQVSAQPDEVELVLSQEEIVVTKRIVPIERVRLVRDRVTEERHVTETLRKERIDVEQVDSAVD